MRAYLASSISFGTFVACLALGAGGACGGIIDSAASGEGGGASLGDGDGDGDGSPDGRLDAAADAPPAPSEPLTVFGAYAVRTVLVGDTDRSVVLKKDAWKDYGENLDGIVSAHLPQGECKLRDRADSSNREDGPGGIDNAFGRTVLELLLGVVGAPSKAATAEVAKGGRTMLFNLLPVSGAAPARFGFLTAGILSTPPTWDGSDVRAVTAASATSGPDDALATSTTPAMSGRLVASGIAGGTFYFEMLLDGAVWRIPVRHARVTMTISDDGLRATMGTLSGIVPTEELVSEFRKTAGNIATQLCSGITLETILTTIRQASDILVDGTQDPTRECDGISIGIGFDAVKVTATGIAPEPPPAPDPCH